MHTWFQGGATTVKKVGVHIVVTMRAAVPDTSLDLTRIDLNQLTLSLITQILNHISIARALISWNHPERCHAKAVAIQSLNHPIRLARTLLPAHPLLRAHCRPLRTLYYHVFGAAARAQRARRSEGRR